MSAAPPTDLEDALSRLRPHTTSKLVHQKKPALLLRALEGSLPQPITPTAYYAALIQTLQQAVAKEIAADDALATGEGDLIPAVLYLLSTIIDWVAPAVFHAQSELGLLGPLFAGSADASTSDDHASQSILSLFAPCAASAPSLRSLMHLARRLLLTAPPAALTTGPYVATLNTLLSLSLDTRPRVRKVAQEAVRDVLKAPPPPATRHPYAERVAKWLVKVLGERVKNEDGEQRRIWAVGFVKMVASSWPSDQISPLLAVLLPLPAHPHLQATTLSLLSHLLSQSTSAQSLEPHKIPLVLLEILATPPTDHSVVPSWLEVVENGMISWSREDPAACAEQFARVWSLVWGYLSDDKASERGMGKAAERCLAGLARYCVTEAMMVDALEHKIKAGPVTVPAKVKGNKKQIHPQQQTASSSLPVLSQIIITLQTSLHALRAISYLPSTLVILSALISRLRLRPATSAPLTAQSKFDPRLPTAAQGLLLDLVRDVGDLRIQKGFESKEKADDVLGMAIEVAGPEAILEILPLNVEADRDPSQPGRAFLLPILRQRTTNTSLTFFTQTMVPLSERLFNAKTRVEHSRPIEAKVYEALVEQVWACLKGFCDVPIDLPKAFTNEFAALITQVLYTQPSLRPTLLRSLQTLVETSTSLSNSSAPMAELKSSFGLTQADGKANIEFLKGMAKNLLAVLFNVFAQVGREQRGMVGEVITSYMGVTSDEDIAATYTKVVTHLGQALLVPFVKGAGGNANAAPGAATPTSHTMLDLLIILVPFLPATSAKALFGHAAGEKLIGSEDPAVQKKSYRVIARLIETGKVLCDGEGIEEFVTRLADGGEVVAAAARRDRVLLLTVLIPLFPNDKLHLIPALLPEAVLGTKEVNEKTRDAAFELVVLMGNKMAQGGTIKRSLLEGMDADEADEDDEEAVADAAATIPEYITMVAAGLAGTSPHMISATITAISRLLFEFKDSIPSEMLNDLISTLVVFVTSNNREIVKSSLGFVKVIAVTLSAADVRPHLPALVPGLLAWSHDHKNHFKGKVRHIFERLIRKFGYDEVVQCAEGLEGDGVKFLENIKKRKERSKRKKAARSEGAEGGEDVMSDDDGEPSKLRNSTGNAFEDALYGSDSDISDSDDEAGGAQRGDQRGNAKGKGKGRDKNVGPQTFIREDGDEPMDLLDRTLAGRVTKHDPNATSRRRKPGQEAAKFALDAETGRMVINDNSDNEGPSASAALTMDEDLSGRAYQEQLTSTEGMTRGRGGRIIFNKDTKRGRAIEAEGDMGMVNANEGGHKKQKKEKQTKSRVGQEFKAKNAGGDVKRNGGPDPFAYVPLSQARSKKGGKKSQVNITGKKRGSAA